MTDAERDLVVALRKGSAGVKKAEGEKFKVMEAADAGIKVIMVTGDHPHTATAIAR